MSARKKAVKNVRKDTEGKSKTILVSIIVPIVVAIVGVLGVRLFNGAKDELSGKTDVTVALAVGVSGSSSNRSPQGFAFPGRQMANLPVPSSISPESCSGIDRRYVENQRGYEIGDSWSLLTVFSRTSTVVIQSISITTISVDRPTSSLVVENACGGGIQDPYLHADLDTDHVSYDPPTDPLSAEQGRQETAARSPYGRAIPAGQSYSIPFDASADKGVYRWKLTLNLLVDGVAKAIDAQTDGLTLATGAEPTHPTYITLDGEEGSRHWAVGP